MALVFLSYTYKDKELAIRVQKAIEDGGHRVWRDDSMLRVGAAIPHGVATGVAVCDHLALVITKNALDSAWMRGELNLYAADVANWERIIALKCDVT